jgi:hypothetical protein
MAATELQTKEGILAFLQRNRPRLISLGLRRIGLFGSLARGELSEESDIDILVEFLPGRKSYRNFINLAWFLEDNLHRSVDLLTPESLSPYIGPHVLQEAQYIDLAG